jgi:hypothetical protein
MGQETLTGYSTSIRLWLRYSGRIIPLSHSSATFVIAWQPIDLPVGDAEIVFTVDGTPYERAIKLPNGMQANSYETMISSRDDCAPF